MAKRPIKNSSKELTPMNFKKSFHLEFLNIAQKMAFSAFEQHDVLFLLGPAGTGKTFLACAFAISEFIAKKKKRIIITRPIVESGESLGFLPGSFEEKVHPYMLPIYDCIGKLVGYDGSERERIDKAVEKAPLAYLRGRAQPLDSILMTPEGPKFMGEIEVGDYVLGANGKPTKVIGVYPQGNKSVVEVVFNDRTKVRCCKDHLWATETLSEKRHNRGWSVKDVNEISKYIKTKYGQKNHRIPILSSPAEFTHKGVAIDPYLLGLLIGDGSLHKKACITLSTVDVEILENAKKLCPDNIQVKHIAKCDYKLTKTDNNKRNFLKTALRELGLLGKKSYNKFIPDSYKFNSTVVRHRLLQGLMDTDGSVFKDGNNLRTEFSSTSETLANDVIFLVQSLGGTAFLYEKTHNDVGHFLHGHLVCHRRMSYRVMIHLPPSINPFCLSRKANKWALFVDYPVRLIAEVNDVGEQKCQCIKVEASDNLYLTNGFVVTHNTFDNAVCIFDEAQNASYMQLKLFLTRMGTNCKLIITGDPKQSDLRGEVALVDVVKRLENELGIGIVEFKANSIVRHPLVGRIIERLEDKD